MSQSNRKIIILDGGMSRELIRLGAPFRQPEWSALSLIEEPNYVRQVHAEFADAGADVITADSYALVPFHIGEERFQKQGEELATLAGKLAREVADQHERQGRPVLVAGCLPPIFGSYEPQNFEASKVLQYLEVLVRALTPCTDIWLGETLSLIEEGEAVKKATAQSDKPLWISFTLDDSDEASKEASPRLRSKQPVEEAARWALKTGLDALLFNCSKPEAMNAAIRAAKKVFDTESRSSGHDPPFIGVYANAFQRSKSEGEPEANKEMTETRAEMTAEAYAGFAREWVESGATIVGGCCGIGHEHIRQLAQEFKS